MALVIEDGSLVAGANSFATVAEARAFAVARASTFYTGDDTGAEAALIRAMDYLEALRDDFKGTKVSATQALQWPRSEVYLDGFPIEETEIPDVLKNAQIQAAMEAASIDLSPTGTGEAIKREKVDVIETEFFHNSGATQPVLTKVRAWLAPLLKPGTFGGNIPVSRA